MNPSTRTPLQHRFHNRAVSPVIGVVLMVAITIILAAVIGAFVLGMGTGQEAPPFASVAIQAGPGDGNITLIHDGGDTLDLDEHTLLVGGDDAGVTGTLRSGQEKTVEGLDPADDVVVVLRHEPSGEVVARATVTIE